MSDAPAASATHTNLSTQLTTAGQIVSRYGLVVVLAWIGFGKYAKMEARVLIEHSPLMSWIYEFLSVHAVAATLGTLCRPSRARHPTGAVSAQGSGVDRGCAVDPR